MKAITLTQPWATLVAIGAKQIETRSWSTKYRGPLAIHAASSFPKLARQLQGEYSFSVALANVGDLPLGMVIATCDLVACIQIPETERSFDLGAFTTPEFVRLPPHEPERTFGDYAPGRWAWILGSVRRLESPVIAKGALGLWEFNGIIEAPRQSLVAGDR